MSLAEISDLEDLLGSTVDQARAQKLLHDASATVVAYTGQQFTRSTTTATVRVPRSRWLRLGQLPVHSVDAIVDLNDNPLTFEFDGIDRVRVPRNIDSFQWEPWASPIRTVKVTYDHGFDDIPPEIVAVVCQVAGRAYGVRADDTGINQETLGAYNYSTGAAASSGALGLLLPERAVLDRFRQGVRTVQVQ